MKSKSPCLNVAAIFSLCALYAGLISNAHSGEVLPSRSALLSQLGSAAVTEKFESYLFPTNTAKRVGAAVDATSVIDGQGPGLVVQGVRFLESPRGEGLQWDRQFEYGLQSAALCSETRLIVDFTTPVTHAGFDMFWFDVPNTILDPSTVQVFAADDVSMLYATNIVLPRAPNSVFFGFTENRGIGRIVLFIEDIEGFDPGPLIDNLTFGFVPSLSIGLSGEQFTLSWPQVATTYQLEATIYLGLQASWTAVTNSPVPLHGQNTVTLSPEESSKFFRLRSQ